MGDRRWKLDVLHYIDDKGRTAWRGDCWGDAFNEDWNHHDRRYIPGSNSISGSWKNGLIVLEPCDVMNDWKEGAITPEDIDYVVNQTLKLAPHIAQ